MYYLKHIPLILQNNNNLLMKNPPVIIIMDDANSVTVISILHLNH